VRDTIDITISTPVRWVIFPLRAKFGVASRGAGPKLKIPLPKSFVPRLYRLSYIDLGPAVSLLYDVENVDTARTDQRMTDISLVFIIIISGEMTEKEFF